MHLSTLLARRLVYLYGFLASAALMAGALLYFQSSLGLAPCPLCIFQRVFVILVGAVCLLAFLHNPRGWGNRVYGVGGALLALAGAAVSARHVYIQNLPPDQLPGCGPGLDYMLEVLPVMQILEQVFRGSGECAEVLWRFLGLTIPGWTLVAFVAMLAGGLYQAFRSSP